MNFYKSSSIVALRFLSDILFSYYTALARSSPIKIFEITLNFPSLVIESAKILSSFIGELTNFDALGTFLNAVLICSKVLEALFEFNEKSKGFLFFSSV